MSACSSAPAPAPAPTPAPAPADEPPPPTSMVTPRGASGSYRLTTVIQNPSGQRRGNSGQNTPMTLNATPLAAPIAQGGPSTQFGATVSVPGYSRAPRGRSGQAAAWWPIPGDSVVVQFTASQQNIVQMRGKLVGTTLTGELWFTSAQTGSSFQLGTFSASKR